MFKKNEKGITAAELLIVIAIIGLFSLFAVPAFRETLMGFRLKGDAMSLENLFRLSRHTAVSRRSPVIAEVSLASQTFVAAEDENGNKMVDDAEKNNKDYLVQNTDHLQMGVEIASIRNQEESESGVINDEPTRFRFNPDGTISRLDDTLNVVTDEEHWRILMRIKVKENERYDKFRLKIVQLTGKVDKSFQRNNNPAWGDPL